MQALSHMRACAVLHADIKPDNILCDASQRVVKICDFGSAMLAGDNEVTPYLVSRFYRSPEVMLGLKYGEPALRCIIELATALTWTSECEWQCSQPAS